MTLPEQHARDGEVREAADAPRHQLQLSFGHGRVRVRGREEVGCEQARVKSIRGTRAGHPRWAGLAVRGVASARLGKQSESGSDVIY